MPILWYNFQSFLQIRIFQPSKQSITNIQTKKQTDMTSLPHQTSFESQTDQEEFQVLDISNSNQQAYPKRQAMEAREVRTKDAACQIAKRNCQECPKTNQSIEGCENQSLEAILKINPITHCSACHQAFMAIKEQLLKVASQKTNFEKLLHQKNTEVHGLASISQEHKKYTEKLFKKNKELEQTVEQVKTRKQKQLQQRSNQIMSFYEQKLQSSMQEVEALQNQLAEIMSSFQKAGVQVKKQSDIPSLISQLFNDKQNFSNNSVTEEKIINIYKLIGKQKLGIKKFSNDYCLSEIEKSLKSMSQELLILKKNKKNQQQKLRKLEKVVEQKQSFQNSSTMGNLVKRKNNKN